MSELPTTPPRLTVPVADGKYTFIVAEQDYRIHILRHGEPWLVLSAGSGAVLALMLELDQARSQAEVGPQPSPAGVYEL